MFVSFAISHGQSSVGLRFCNGGIWFTWNMCLRRAKRDSRFQPDFN
ncbi:hypothetical protein HMPREF7215_0710 [Pyramidobacter piscolens W5455]|uniref:Uncharacterized protein n=1 Tax=Pyramidobacter piscolens W5455 TaxID=352165 RepID=A0ABM9ZUP2_9BACT|nr:hypothetical protein HMPREF7215_0710 [Pyramidobacter piscolens W5455]